jgi:hypothetical protein
MRGDGVGELGIGSSICETAATTLGRDLLVELHIALELADDRTAQRLDLDLLALFLGQAAASAW